MYIYFIDISFITYAMSSVDSIKNINIKRHEEDFRLWCLAEETHELAPL